MHTDLERPFFIAAHAEHDAAIGRDQQIAVGIPHHAAGGYFANHHCTLRYRRRQHDSERVGCIAQYRWRMHGGVDALSRCCRHAERKTDQKHDAE
jgi:hypothetical protein